MALFFFSKVVSFVLPAMLEGMLLPFNIAAKISSCLYLVETFIVMFTCAVNVIT